MRKQKKELKEEVMQVITTFCFGLVCGAGALVISQVNPDSFYDTLIKVLFGSMFITGGVLGISSMLYNKKVKE